MTIQIRCQPKDKNGNRGIIKTHCCSYCPHWNECVEEGKLNRINIECVINFIRHIFSNEQKNITSSDNQNIQSENKE